MQVNFQPLREDLEARDEKLAASIERLREDLYPIRDDLEKVERTRDEQRWMLIHGLQQQTVVIRPLHSELSSVQLAANQNFHAIVTKLDGNTAALELVNQKVNTIRQFLWGGLRKLPVRLIPSLAPTSFLQQSLDESCYLAPQVEDEDGWLTFLEREIKLSGNPESIDMGRTEKTAMAIDSLEAPADNLLIKDKNSEREVQRFEEENAAQGISVGRSIDPVGDSVPETKTQYTLAAQSLEQSRPAQELVVTQQTMSLKAIYTKIIALEERIRDREDVAVHMPDFSELEKAAAAILRAYEAALPMQNSSGGRQVYPVLKL